MNVAWLIPVAGPAIEPLQVDAKENGAVVGRHDACDLRLPPDSDKISRQHARFEFCSGRWTLTDLKSSWGTFLNGVRLTPHTPMPLSDGDLIRLTPWTLNFTTRGLPKRGLRTSDDGATMHSMIRSIAPDHAASARSLGDDLLGLLLEGAAAIHGATDEKALADVVIDAAMRGTGLTHAAVLRPVDNEGRVEIISSRATGTTDAPVAFSRSLIAAASGGSVAELSASADTPTSQSIVQMKISAALCVPLMLGQTPAAYLYLDSRGRSARPQSLRVNASSFCLALGRMASLALANLKRIDIEKRQATLEAELNAAALAQKWILPARTGGNARYTYVGQSVPGQTVGGDFFDVIPLSDDRLAVALGDVSGKGISASVLMTAAQGFLHACLVEHQNVARAVTQLNAFLHPRRQAHKFVTMWVGLFTPTPTGTTLTYVDAGHGHAVLMNDDGTFAPLSEGDGLPVGVMDGAVYSAETITFAPGAKAVVMSDGILEQFSPAGNADQFDMDRVKQALSTRDVDPVQAIFDAVVAHAGTTQLADDATVVVVQC